MPVVGHGYGGYSGGYSGHNSSQWGWAARLTALGSSGRDHLLEVFSGDRLVVYWLTVQPSAKALSDQGGA
jgi:hypothetical protein